MTSVQAAILSGGSESNTFAVNHWTGNATLNGASNLYTVEFLGSGTGTITINDGLVDGIATVNAPAASSSLTITADAVTLGNETVNYTGLTSLTVNGAAGNDSFTINGMGAGTATTANGGAGTNSATVTFAQDFVGTLSLVNFQNATLQVGGNFNGTFSATSPGTLQQVTIGLDLSGTVQTTGNLQTLSVGRSITSTGRVIVGGGLVAASVGQDLAGQMQVTSAIGSLTVQGSLTGTASTQADLSNLNVAGNVLDQRHDCDDERGRGDLGLGIGGSQHYGFERGRRCLRHGQGGGADRSNDRRWFGDGDGSDPGDDDQPSDGDG